MAWPAHEGFQEDELLGGELDLGIATPSLVSRRIEAQVANLNDRRPLALSAPDQGSKPGQQLGEGERLGQVIVGPAVEPGNAVLERAASGKHQHWRPDPLLAQAPAGLEAVDAGQDHVENDRVVTASAGHADRFLTSARDVNGQALLAETTPDQRRHLHLVLDDQDIHALNHPREDECQMRDDAPSEPAQPPPKGTPTATSPRRSLRSDNPAPRPSAAGRNAASGRYGWAASRG